MLQLAPTFAFVILACLGAGRIFLFEAGKAAGKEDRPGDSLLRAGFSGLCGLGLLALVGCCANVFLPLSTISVWVMSAAAIGTLFRIKGVWPVGRPPEAAILFIFALAFSSRVVLHGDTGNYHHQAVLWMAQETLPFGLANLHGRFGFNSSWWVVGAWMEFPWHPVGASIYLPTGVLCFFFGLIVLGSIRNLQFADAAAVLISCSGYLWFRQLVGINNPSFSTDAPANLFIIASAAALVHAVADEPRKMMWIRIWCLLAASAATFKLTALPWFGFSLLAVACYGFGTKVFGTRLRLASLVCSLALGALVIGVYGIRGVIISGFPFYPTRLLAVFDAPWKVPSSGMAGDTEGIRNWPTRGEGGGVFGFFGRWVENQFGFTNVVFGVVVLATVAVLGILAIRAHGMARLRAVFLPLLPITGASMAGLAVCLVYAPALRFVSGYFFVTAGLLVAGFLSQGNWLRATISRRVIIGLLAAAAVLPNLSGVARLPVALAVPPPLPPPEVEEKKTLQGEVVRVNSGGGSWAAPLPSTPYFDADLIIWRDRNGKIREFSPPQPPTFSD